MREFYDKMATYHQNDQARWAKRSTPKRRLGVRIADQMYVYVHEDGVHIRTLHVAVPDRQMEHWTWTDRHIRGQRVPVDLDE